MKKPIRIAQTDAASCGIVAYVYERAADGSETLVDTRVLTSAADVADVFLTATRYVVVRASEDEAAKSIDNW